VNLWNAYWICWTHSKSAQPELELPIECYESAVAREQHGVELGYWEPLLPQMGVEYVYDPARMPDLVLAATATYWVNDYLLFYEREQAQWWLCEAPKREDPTRWWRLTPSEAQSILPDLNLTIAGLAELGLDYPHSDTAR
jgi:hypothetical protein